MSGVILGNTLRIAWKQMLYWGLGLGILGAYIIFIASNSDIVQGYADLFDSLPPALMNVLGASGSELFRTTEGWVVTILVSELALFISVYAVMAGLAISANEEQSGILDVVLSLPISRRAFLLERWLAYALLAFGIVLISALLPTLTAIGVGLDADIGIIAASIMAVYPGALVVIAATVLLSTLFRRRIAAIGAVSAFVIGSYMASILGGAASGFLPDLLEALSYFSYVGGESIVSGEYEPTGALGLLAAAGLAFVLSAHLFDRRDIGT
ncbi:MAG: ABC transporter permease subunit [Chloroflexi bacterium]|nr:ABC transporter permease subunit [Chloroflexota bacterium]MCY4247146.1 ABC transporter permease subunit [Chloroflexota bacterium]